MRKILVVVIACFALNFGYSQVFNSERSSTHFTKESEKDTYKIIFPSAYGFMTLHHLDNVMMDNNKTMVLTKYDQSMQSIESMDFNLPKLGLRASDLVEVIELKDQLIFISKVMHKKMAKHQVNAQVYSQKDNSVSENKVLASFPIKGYSKSGHYEVVVSPDQSKIAIIGNMPFVKKTKEKVNISVYDNKLNLLWEQNETLIYDSERAYQEQAFVTNTGEVILNKTTNAYKKTRKSELLTFNGSTVDTQDFSSPGFVPMEMQLIDVNGKSMLTGFYFDGKKTIIKINSKEGDDTSGAFLYDLSQSNLIGIHEWSSNLNAKDLKSLAVVDVKVVGDDIYMIGEKQLYKSEFRKNGSTPTTDMDYFYTYGSSVIVNFDTKGTLKGYTPLLGSKTYKNYAKERGSVSALFLENGLRVFANSSHVTFNSFFTQNKETFNYPRIPQSTNIPYALPKTVKAVNDYNIVYYITNSGDKYWFNKMTW